MAETRRWNPLTSGLAFERAVALGLVPHTQSVIRAGRNPDVDDLTVPEDVWNGGGLYVGFPPGAAETVTVVSSDAADKGTATAGTGLRTLLLFGLDADYAEQTESVTLDGTNAVTSNLTWTRISSVVGTSAGSSGTNVGAITVRHSSTTANIFSVMPAGFGSSQAAVYTVPAGKTGLLLQGQLSVSNNQQSAQEVSAGLATRRFGTGIFVVTGTTICSTTAGGVVPFPGGVVFPEKTDLVVRVLSSTSANLVVQARFDLLVLDSTLL